MKQSKTIKHLSIFNENATALVVLYGLIYDKIKQDKVVGPVTLQKLKTEIRKLTESIEFIVECNTKLVDLINVIPSKIGYKELIDAAKNLLKEMEETDK